MTLLRYSTTGIDLARRIRRHHTGFEFQGPKVSAMNPRDSYLPPTIIGGDGIEPGVALIAQPYLGKTRRAHAAEFIRPVAVLAGFAGRHETIAFHSTEDRSSLACTITGFDQLADSTGLAGDPPGSAGHHMTFDALHPGVRANSGMQENSGFMVWQVAPQNCGVSICFTAR